MHLHIISYYHFLVTKLIRFIVIEYFDMGQIDLKI